MKWDWPGSWEARAYNIGKSNLTDNGDTKTLTLAVPGLKKEDLKITVNNGILMVETISEKPAGAKMLHEGLPSKYEYNFDITGYIVEGAICADGLLDILIRKSEASNLIRIR